MRLLLSASILSVTHGIQSPLNVGTSITNNAQVTQQVEAAYTSSRGERFLGQECKPATSPETDVGILGCRNPKASCEQDDLSSLGGRCALDRSLLTPKIDTPIFTHRRESSHLLQSTPREDTPRFLQNYGWSCPSGCPKEFCKCAQKHGEVKHCAKQMDDLCLDGLVSECVPNEYLPFYYQTYCPFSECIVANNAYHDCSCQYYRDYCTLYYAFNESTSKCNIAACCEAAVDADSKMMCLPGLQPSISPTMQPTVSAVPSGVPSLSLVPTVSPKPSVSAKPTASPTISSEPTISPPPTDAPSATPSFSPTISFPPTRPASEPPSTSTVPTVTASPTNIDAPSTIPSVSKVPTESPTIAPTFTASPTETPKTDAPTYEPTKKPSRRPTRKPTQKPTRPPSEQTEPPTDSTSNSSSIKSTVLSFLGAAGAAWFLMW